jgi:hypothetical protein
MNEVLFLYLSSILLSSSFLLYSLIPGQSSRVASIEAAEKQQHWQLKMSNLVYSITQNIYFLQY